MKYLKSINCLKDLIDDQLFTDINDELSSCVWQDLQGQWIKYRYNGGTLSFNQWHLINFIVYCSNKDNPFDLHTEGIFSPSDEESIKLF